jgi:hypothetical protein
MPSNKNIARYASTDQCANCNTSPDPYTVGENEAHTCAAYKKGTGNLNANRVAAVGNRP